MGERRCGSTVLDLDASVSLEVNALTLPEDVWGRGGVAPQFLTSTLDGSEWSSSRSLPLLPRQCISAGGT
jgi:hypothetical protein